MQRVVVQVVAKQKGRIGRDGQGRGVFVGAVMGFDDGELVAAVPVLEAGCGGGGRSGRNGRWPMNVRCHKRGRLRKRMDSIMN